MRLLCIELAEMELVERSGKIVNAMATRSEGRGISGLLSTLRVIPLLGAVLFAEPALAQSGNVSFSDAFNEFMRRDLITAIQKAKLENTREANRPLKLAFLPNISLSHTEYRTHARTPSAATLSTRRGGLSADWNVFRFGADYSNWQASLSDIEKQSQFLSREELRAERNAADRIFSYVRFANEVEISDKIFDSEKENHRIARLRFERGLLPQQEVEKVFIDLVNAEARVKNAEIKRTDAEAQLTAGMGHSRVRLDWPWLNTFLRGKVALTQANFNLENVPAWRTANAGLEAEEARVQRNLRRILPKVDINADYNFRNTTTTLDEWSGNLSVSVPLFDKLSNYSNYAAQVQTRAVAELEFEQTRRDAVAEYNSARDSFSTALETALARNESLRVARRLYRDNELRFKNGKINANDLIVDQDRLFRTELNALEGWYNAHVAYVRLCHSLGRKLESCTADL